MKYCVCASQNAAMQEPVLYRAGYDGLFGYAKALGYGGVEIHLRAADDVDAAALEAGSRASGIALAGIATGLGKRIDGLELVDREEKGRRAAIQRLKEQIDLAARFPGCQVIIGSMRGNIPGPEQDAETRGLLLQSMRELTEHLKGKDCGVVFEAINRYENNYLNTAAETVEFVKTLGSPQVKVLLDTFHMNIEERDLPGAIRATGPYLGHIHLADNTRWYPGSGSLDFSAILRALRDIGYAGWLSFEYLPMPDERTGAAKGVEYIKRLWDCLQ